MIINGNNVEPFPSEKFNVEPFPIEKFNKNWPFCEDLAFSFFENCLSCPDYCSSLKEFFSFKHLFYDTVPYDSENESDDETACIYDLPFSSFFIEYDTLYYNKNDDGPTYTLGHIPYNTLVCEAVRHCVKNSIKTDENQSIVWRRVFTYLLDQRFSVLNVLIEENFIEKMKPTIIQTFYNSFKISDKIASWLNIRKEKSYPIVFSKEALLNILLYCEFPKTDSDILVTDFFREKSYKNILLYYQNVLFDLFQITEDYYK